LTLNPVRFTRSVTDEFRRYQLTAFPIADPRLAAQASALLGASAFRASPLTKGPYVSLARALAQGASLSELAAEGVIHDALPGIAEFPQLFAHQEQTLRAVGDDKHVLVSTGTGSGKTESFLYPIIDRCLRLRDESAEQGLVAVLVYPMNALASDQRDRLRLLLAGTGITYGMFVGFTPSTPGQASVRHLAEGQGRDALVEAMRRRRANDEEVVPFEECASEQEIRERKPRILITNANQLELLLTRPQDFELFTGAPLRFVILDEAHTYSGATGAEVACLVRRLRAFAGKSADEVTCIATSATIVDPVHGAEVGPEFLSRLTGVGQESVELVREQYEPLTWPGRRTIPDEPTDPYATLEAVLSALGTPPPEDEPLAEEADIDRDALAEAVTSLTGEHVDLPEGLVGEALFDHLESTEPVRILMEELEHPRSLEEVTGILRERLGRTSEPPETSTAEVLAYLALGAFARRGDAPLLRPKLHMFVRGLEGAVVTFEDDPAAPVLHFSARDALGAGPGDRLPTGIFPLSVCRTCGQHYMTIHLHGYEVADGAPAGGEAAGDSAYWVAVADGDEEGASRVRFTDWFLAEGDPDEDDGDATRAKASARLDAHRSEAWLCRWCGAVRRDESESCLNLTCGRPGPLVRVYLVLEERGFRCLGCGARGGSHGGRTSEPIRPLRASSVADVHILAQEMISAAGSEEERRL
jgi:DEAD/DEAH box helicase